MNKSILITISLILVIGGGLYLFNKQSNTAAPSSTSSLTTEQSTGLVKDSADQNSSSGKYVIYSADYLEKYKNKTKVLYFFASWCPTCKVANREITEGQDKIPENAVIIKTDYDTQKDLKKKYGVTYQHTFVIVDNQGNEVTKWNGGGLEEILRRL
jgi:thioredoxin 1